MKFYLRDKNLYELNIITDILTDNHIKHKVITNHIPCIVENEDDDEDSDWVDTYYVAYDVCLDTTLELFDYMKYLINKRLQIVNYLNECSKKKVKKKKNEANIPK